MAGSELGLMIRENGGQVDPPGSTRKRLPEGRVIPVAGVELRAAGTESGYQYLEGRAVPYNTPANIGGFFMESFAPGAFAKSIAEAARSLPLLAFHDTSTPDALIGVAESWEERSDGLHGVWRLDKSDAAQRIAQLAADGVLGYMSVRFQPIRSEWTYVDDWDPDRGPAYLDSVMRTEARLVEVSTVSTPAYASATITKVRSADRAMSAEASGHVVRGWKSWLEQQTRRDATVR